jgi:glycine/D-amino acid oxidase-like deaminating enzyme
MGSGPSSDERERGARRITRRAFVAGVAAGGIGGFAGATLPRWALQNDPHRPPSLYEFFVDNFWFESARLYEEHPNPPLRGQQLADVVILGGGFAGMSTAFHLAERLPGKRVVLIEGAVCGYGASGRNGGFADPGSPGLHTVYDEQGPEAARRYYDATLLGLAQIRDFAETHGVDCELESNGGISLATRPEHLPVLEATTRRYDEMGLPCELLGASDVRRVVASDRFIGGLRDPAHAILNPAKLARGMKRVIEGMGVEIFERSRILHLELGSRVHVECEQGEIEAQQAVVTLNGYAPQIGLFRQRLLPLTNYVVATEPLSPAQRESIGWAGREGLSDMRVQFMYMRPTADGRIVFGGESSPYFYDSQPASGSYAPALERLQRSLLVTFPQLEGVRFSHGWGGTMGFTLDFMPSIGRLDDAPNVFYALAFNGEGVVMTQLAGRIVADLVSGEPSPLTALPIVGRSMPWLGPEPFRSLGVKVTEGLLERWGGRPLG